MVKRWVIECDQCGGEGILDYGCTCGDDTCCCAEPESPECWKCRGNGSYIVKELSDDNYDRATEIDITL